MKRAFIHEAPLLGAFKSATTRNQTAFRLKFTHSHSRPVQGMTPCREAGRALRRAQEDFRKNQRSVKKLLEKQKQRYSAAAQVTEVEAQVRVRVVTDHYGSIVCLGGRW